MKQLKYTLFTLLVLVTGVCRAESTWEEWKPTGSGQYGFILRAGYTLGGTTPIPPPREIRSINSFSPKGGPQLGIDVYRMFRQRWGASIGCHFFWEGFSTSANVMNYHMSLTDKEGNNMKGYFTGCNVTRTQMVGVTLPLLCTFRLSPRWNVNFGPFVSILFYRDFEGEVFDNPDGIGYLREDTPTGKKVIIDRENPATYDFQENMRHCFSGLELGFDWKATRRINLYGKVDWSLSDIFRSDFEAITFRMTPIYGTIGAGYRY